MSNSYNSFYTSFVKYFNLIFRYKYPQISFGLANCILFESLNNYVQNNTRNDNHFINKKTSLQYNISYKIKSSLQRFSYSKIAYTEEDKAKKSCCDTTDPKEHVLTDKAFEKIKFEIDTYEVVLFMKGNARKPSCGFSRQALDILKALKIDTIRTVNILEDEDLRFGLKVYSNYPNFPQLYVRGKFVGGLETISKMYSDGTLEKLLRDV